MRETAVALGAFRGDHAGLVAACRRVVERQATSAPLWWLCARMLCGTDPTAEARAAVEEVAADPTGRHLAAELPDSSTVVLNGRLEQVEGALRRRGDLEVLLLDGDGSAGLVVDRLEMADVDAVEVPVRNTAAALRGAALLVVEALAVGPREALVPAGTLPAAAAAAHLGVPVWLVAGVGWLMPERMFEGLVRRWSATADELDADEELVGLDLVDRIAGAGGVLPVAEALRLTDCPVAPELLGPTG